MLSGNLVRKGINVYRDLPVKPFRGLVRCFFQWARKRASHQIVIDTIDGVVFELDLGERIESKMHYFGSFEPITKNLLMELCQPGMTVLDVGANIGVHTFFMAREIGSEGIVYAFEPASYAFRKLEKNQQLNPKLSVKLIRAGLAETEIRGRETEVICSWPVDRSNGILGDTPIVGGRVMKDTIDLIKLDNYVQQENIEQLDLIKLDVDGHEPKVLEGGGDTIRRFKPIIVFELCDYVLKYYGSSARELLTMLDNLGYRWYHEEKRPILEKEIAYLESENGSSLNAVAIAKDNPVPFNLNSCCSVQEGLQE